MRFAATVNAGDATAHRAWLYGEEGLYLSRRPSLGAKNHRPNIFNVIGGCRAKQNATTQQSCISKNRNIISKNERVVRLISSALFSICDIHEKKAMVYRMA